MRPGPDLAFYNGTVFDGARFMPVGTVVRVSNGAVTAVGPADSEPAGKLAGAEPVDLRGGTLLPGFIDAHVHPVFAGDQMCRCDLTGVKTAAEYAEIIAAYAAAHPDADWIT
ncbi:MAG TPA: amidohydrolase family protein, partial [Streptosporangiaceae bacterium]